ncbi:MAG: MATE family efflux transporter [Eubacterium sp.]|nr:MATE family efflux transporter [Eubacterium sp.]
MQKDLTKGPVFKVLLVYSLPYLLACFLQTFYGMADLFITGMFNRADAISAVSIGSQVMHMLTVMLVGLAMGSTVSIGRAIGAGDREDAAHITGNTVTIFAILAAGLTVVLLLANGAIIRVLSTPAEAVADAQNYLMICFAGVPFIIAYNVISSIFRGIGDTKSPMIFVAVAGILNVFLDLLFIGPFGMRAAGAALATVISQAFSVLFSLVYMRRLVQKGKRGEQAGVNSGLGFELCRRDFRPESQTVKRILGIGVPISLQDGFIQISFLVITVIVNRRGVVDAAAVGIVEKVISFLFLVPSAMLSSVSAIAAQNAGAGMHERGLKTLKYAIGIGLASGAVFTVIAQFASAGVVGLFTSEEEVIRAGSLYFRAYVFDCMFAAVHFCFSGFFSAYGKAGYSFLHNILAILLVRIPGAYFASVLFPNTLLPMGMAAPGGSLLSDIICLIIFCTQYKKWIAQERNPANQSK